MKATGVIVEYNPFHNGHIYHAQEARKTTNADVLIAVMSGNFLQRGEPAFIDKTARTKTALQNGVDLVIELPYAFATAHAPIFATGAIQILDAIRCDAFCFGSEEGEISPFENSIDMIEHAGATYEQAVSDAVSRGLSYPKALNEAYTAASLASGVDKPTVDLTKPNNILGFHYIKAARDIQSKMKATTIARVGANYHDHIVEGNSIASATGIRKSFFDSATLDTVSNFIPSSTLNELSSWQENHVSFASWNTFYPLLRYSILRDGPERLAKIADITEGIENLFFRAAASNDNFAGFMNEVKSKRYTWTRLQRMLTHIYTGFTYDLRDEINSPRYLRLLGMNRIGQLYLNKNKKQLKLPLVSKAANFSDPSLQLDIHAANMYALGTPTLTNQSNIGADYKISPIILP